MKQIFLLAIVLCFLFSCRKKANNDLPVSSESGFSATILHIQSDFNFNHNDEPEDFYFGKDSKITVDSSDKVSIDNIYRRYYRKYRTGKYYRLQYLNQAPLLVADSLKQFWPMLHYRPDFESKHYHFLFSLNKDLLSKPLFQSHSFEPENYQETITFEPGSEILVSSHDSILANVIQRVNSFFLDSLPNKRFVTSAP